MDKELLEILERYRASSETHDARFMLLMDKHIENFRRWVALVKTVPVDTPEFAASVADLWKQSKVLGEQFQEVVHDMADDKQILIEFFMKGQYLFRGDKEKK